MAKLKFEIDTDDMFQDYDEEFGAPGWSFEQLFKDGLSKEVKRMAIESASSPKVMEMTEALKMEIQEAVEQKLSGLVNEEVAFTDKWGKAKFVGTVEDYIKNQIDEKLFRPVDSYGKTVSGCSTTEKTWVDWKVEKEISDYLDKIKRSANDQANRFCKTKLDEALEQFKDKTLSSLITERLAAVGVK